MFRQIIVFTKSDHLPIVQGLIDASQSLGISMVTLNPFDEVCWSMEGPAKLPERHKNLEKGDLKDTLLIIRTSGIFFDEADLLFARAMENRGAQIHFPLSSMMILRDKSAQCLWLIENGFSPVSTLFVRGPLTSEQLTSWQPDFEEFVVKSVRGNKGIGVMKFAKDDLLSFWQNVQSQANGLRDQRYLIQPFYQTRELRHLILGERHFFIEKGVPTKPGEFRRNTKFCHLEEARLETSEREHLINTAKILQQKLGAKSLGLDLLYIEGEWKILEVNANPGLGEASNLFKDINLYELYLKCLMT